MQQVDNDYAWMTEEDKRTVLLQRWLSMKQRCENKELPSWPRYGGRGIEVCRLWGDFEPFYRWAIFAGFRPELTLDRWDNGGHVESPHSDFTRGYGTDEHGNRSCYACCAEADKKYMREHGRITLYMTLEKVAVAEWHENIGTKLRKGTITNWPGSLSIPIYQLSKGRHNLAGTRYDVWFDFEGAAWHGVRYGEDTELCHCKRTKS
jgi:hypothetical protein